MELAAPREKTAREMTDDELTAERKRLEVEWDELQRDLEESGGMAGSPGEWIVERLDEINSERTRRLISLDGDIGRRNPRTIAPAFPSTQDHGPDSWDANPEVVALTFAVQKSNIDALPKSEAA